MLPDPVVLSVDFSIVFVNEAGACLLGASSAEELVGRSVFDFIPAEEHEETRRQVSLMLHVGRPSDIIERIWLRTDGRPVWVEARFVPTTFRGRSAVTALARDVSERKRMERSLLRSEERLHRMIQLSPDAVAVHKDGIITYVNDAALRMFRAERQEMIGRPIRLSLHEDYYESSLRRIHRAIETREPLEFEVAKMVRADGDVFVAELSSVAIDEERNGTSVQTVIRDVTARVAYEEQLLESTVRYRRLIEFLPEPIVITEEGRVLYANQSSVRLIGADSAEAVVGRSIFEFIHPDYHEASRAIVRQVMLSDEPTPFVERRLVRSNGEPIMVELSSIRIHDYEGRSVALSVIRDLTERKRSEDLIIRSEKLSIIGQLAAGVAHEIRNPLTSLKGFTQLLKRDLGQKYHYLDTMMSELDRIHYIVDEFMSLAKPQIGTFREQCIEPILRNVISLLEAEANLYNVSLELTLPPESMPAVRCAENRIKQVFVNTLKNAIQAMPRGGVVRVTAWSGTEGIRVRIQDEGEGIPEEIIQRIGEPFFTTKNEGTGLGLMICHRILEAHQGSMRIASERGAGTTVEIALPFLEPAG
ncbi:PAS domain S-box protein [Paenibacillus sp. TRM 82003]|nr:PAS domain S-box protein [Paenibacillus sp. TRM 82003]